MILVDGPFNSDDSSWIWTKVFVLNPLERCDYSGKWLFLRKAYYGKHVGEYFIFDEKLISAKEYFIRRLTGVIA